MPPPGFGIDEHGSTLVRKVTEPAFSQLKAQPASGFWKAAFISVHQIVNGCDRGLLDLPGQGVLSRKNPQITLERCQFPHEW
ncbi:hypothetical protein ACCT09_51725, partial [Rhizobium ruizarguesonis]